MARAPSTPAVTRSTAQTSRACDRRTWPTEARRPGGRPLLPARRERRAGERRRPEARGGGVPVGRRRRADRAVPDRPAERLVAVVTGLTGYRRAHSGRWTQSSSPAPARHPLGPPERAAPVEGAAGRR